MIEPLPAQPDLLDLVHDRLVTAIADGTLHSYRTCDWVDNAIVLQMAPCDGEVYGHIHLACRVELNRCLATRPAALSHAEPAVG